MKPIRVRAHTRGGPAIPGINLHTAEFDFLKRREGDKGSDEARNLARLYMESKSEQMPPRQPRVKVDPETARRIARAYMEMEDAPNDPRVRAAYEQFAREVFEQWHYLPSDLEVTFTESDPYRTSDEMFADLDQKHLRVYTGGEPHPILSNIRHPHTGRSANDIFRAVHDYFGHYKEGNSFGPNGEENAWRDHAQMFSRSAQGAMTTETRGQNSFFNSAPQNEGKPSAEKQFAPQKAGLLPEEFWPNV